MRSIICPVSPERVNESTVRITGFLVAALLAAYIVSGNVYLAWLLLVDFFIRAFTSLKFSPLSRIAAIIVRSFSLPEIKIPKAPKIFAARVGFLFSLAIVLLHYLEMQGSSVVLGLILIVFALLESLLNICVGCQVYTYVILPLYKMESKVNS